MELLSPKPEKGIVVLAFDDAENPFTPTEAAIAKFLGGLNTRCRNTLDYNLKTNVPAGIQTAAEAQDPLKVITTALCGALGELIQWDLMDAREIASAILEDVNDHDSAAAVRSTIEDISLCLIASPPSPATSEQGQAE